MGMRPPPADDEEGTGPIEFGIAALDARLDDDRLEFPADGDEVVRALDDPEIPYDPHGNTVRLSRVMERCGRGRFESEKDLLNALHPVFEEYRTSTGSGVVAWLRARLPFG